MEHIIHHFRVKQAVEDSMTKIKAAFDNDITPYFALIMCLWGMFNSLSKIIIQSLKL